MIHTTIEASSLKKEDRRSPVSASSGNSSKNKHKHTAKSMKKQSLKPKSRAKIHSKTFHFALTKAVSVRKRVLKRDLTPEEWKRLKTSVRKQCRVPGTDSTSTSLRVLSARVSAVENLVPKDLFNLNNSIAMFQQQISVLRRQLFEMISEKSDISPSCTHHRRRKRIVKDAAKSGKVYISVPVFGPVPLQNSGVDQLCCSSCLQERQDALFEWTGSTVTLPEFPESWFMKDFSHEKEHPLSFHSVWSEIFNRKFSNEF
jgi:hypothetical protein